MELENAFQINWGLLYVMGGVILGLIVLFILSRHRHKWSVVNTIKGKVITENWFTGYTSTDICSIVYERCKTCGKEKVTSHAWNSVQSCDVEYMRMIFPRLFSPENHEKKNEG